MWPSILFHGTPAYPGYKTTPCESVQLIQCVFTGLDLSHPPQLLSQLVFVFINTFQDFPDGIISEWQSMAPKCHIEIASDKLGSIDVLILSHYPGTPYTCLPRSFMDFSQVLVPNEHLILTFFFLFLWTNLPIPLVTLKVFVLKNLVTMEVYTFLT